MLLIQISPTTPGMVLISKRFLVVLAVPIGMIIRETVHHMVAVNAAVQRIIADAVITVHVGGVDVAMAISVDEDDISNKLKLIGKNPAMEDVVTDDAEHRMSLDSEEEHIDS